MNSKKMTAAVAVMMVAVASAQASIITAGINATVAASSTDLLQTNLLGTPVLTGDWMVGGPQDYSAGTGAPGCFYDGVACYANTYPMYKAAYQPASYHTTFSDVSSGSTITFTLNTSLATAGFDITQIDVYHGWADNGRSGMDFKIEYATVANLNTFVNYGTSTYFHPASDYGASRITDSTGTIATGVAKIRITPLNIDNGWGGVSEMDVFGAAAIPEPSTLSLVGMASLGGLALLRRRRLRRQGAH